MEMTFEKEYKRLNKEQKEAVDAIEGPVMVVAGPGTGKTQILSLRIAHILKQTDTASESILALTFTEAGVHNMRKRLATLIGSRAYEVSISTFHTFANNVIKTYPEEFPHIIGSRSITDIDQISLVEEIIIESDVTLLKPFGDTLYYVRGVNSAISELKREGVTPEEFRDIVFKTKESFTGIEDLYHEKGAHKGKMKGEYKDLEKQINKNEELAELYWQYEERLREKKLYDYNDMIMEVLRALRKNEDLLLRLQEEYQYILVDEHQDTNNAQNKILELLASHFAPNPNLFVVGDEKQSIFRFQGASLENFYYFKHLYPEAKLVTLKDNYRSTQPILDSAHSLIAGETSLVAHAPYEQKPIELLSFSKTPALNYFLAKAIKAKITGGVPPHEIAVLYRDNKDAFSVADILEKMGIPFQIESDQDIFAHNVVRKLLIIARAVENFGDDRSLAEYFHLDVFENDPLDVYRIVREASQKRKYNLFDILSDKKMLKDVPLYKEESLRDAYNKLAHWVKRKHNTDLVGLFEEILRESGLLQQILSGSDAQESLDVVDSFFEEVRAIVQGSPEATLETFFSYLDTVKSHNLYIKKRKTGGREGYVRLMTAHRSKGLEFDYVYITYVHNGKWGNKRKIESLKLLPEVYELFEQKDRKLVQDDNDDERRLFYVALTRAKQHVSILYARENEEGKEQLPSQFVSEIDEKLINVIATEQIEREFEEKRGELLQSTKISKAGLKDKDFVRDLFLKQPLSVTALNNYLSCPWTYFYRNLVRLPEPVAPHLMYGTAVHSALEHLFRRLKLDEAIDKKDFVGFFETSLATHPLSSKDLKTYQERGKEALSGWYDTYSDRWATDTLSEFAIRGVELAPDVVLTGKLDKLEFLSDREVNVVDYKTGKPKTRNFILGNTKDSEGSIWRQLVFYKLLLELFKDGYYEMAAGHIDFLEPDPKGGYHKESFTVSSDDVEDLKETIKKMADEVFSLSFWDKRCDKKDCEYCALRDLMS